MNTDRELNQLMREWKPNVRPDGFNAAVWAKVSAAEALPPIPMRLLDRVGFQFSLAMAASLLLAIGIGIGLGGRTGARSTSRYDLLRPGTLAGNYALQLRGDRR